MLFESIQGFKGFKLESAVEISEVIAVITGLNGGGKSRLLRSIKSGDTQVTVDGRIIDRAKIIFLDNSQMRPNVDFTYDMMSREMLLTEIVNVFKAHKSFFYSAYAPGEFQYPPISVSVHDAKSLHKTFAHIARKLNKSVSDLTEAEIRLHYVEPVSSVFSIALGKICNDYLVRRQQNLINHWRSSSLGHDVSYLSPDMFESLFGSPPWEVFNRVLMDVFDGKFQIAVPEEECWDKNYNPVLLSNGAGLGMDDLSSGEQTLLWLSVALFNLIYRGAISSDIPELILLDEPDSFLHPAMVVKLYSFLRRIVEEFNCRILISTHSPTTAALSPDDGVYVVENVSIKKVDKDTAISSLLDGVSQISLNSDNRREVFVESNLDVRFYRYLYDQIRHKSSRIDAKISLSFLAAGPKMQKSLLKANLNHFFNLENEAAVENFLDAVVGVGGCGQVIGMVEALTEEGSRTIRGVVDWDRNNRSTDRIAVLGEGGYYTLENLTLNPLYIANYLHRLKPEDYPIFKFCGRDISYDEWRRDRGALQGTMDYFISSYVGENKRDFEFVCISGERFAMDRRYVEQSGKDLERFMTSTFPELRRCIKDGLNLLNYEMAKSMILDFSDYIPKAFEDLFVALQRK